MSFIKRAAFPVVAGLVLSLQFMAVAGVQAQQPEDLSVKDFPGLAAPPVCVDDRGMEVTYKFTTGEGLRGRVVNFAAAMRDPEVTGKPFILLDAPLLAMMTPQFQNLNYYHECAHHELGHLNKLPKEYSKAEKRAIEGEADCEAAKKLSAEIGYRREDMNILYRNLTSIWQQEGRSYDHARARIGGIDSCYRSAPHP